MPELDVGLANVSELNLDQSFRRLMQRVLLNLNLNAEYQTLLVY